METERTHNNTFGCLCSNCSYNNFNDNYHSIDNNSIDNNSIDNNGIYNDCNVLSSNYPDNIDISSFINDILNNSNMMTNIYRNIIYTNNTNIDPIINPHANPNMNPISYPNINPHVNPNANLITDPKVNPNISPNISPNIDDKNININKNNDKINDIISNHVDNNVNFDIVLQPSSNILCQGHMYTIQLSLNNRIIKIIDGKQYLINRHNKISEMALELYAYDNCDRFIEKFFDGNLKASIPNDHTIIIDTKIHIDAPVGDFYIIASIFQNDKKTTSVAKSCQVKLYKNNACNRRRTSNITVDTQLRIIEKRTNIVDIFEKHNVITIDDVIKKLLSCGTITNNPIYVSIRRDFYINNIKIRCMKKILYTSKNMQKKCYPNQ